MVQDENFSSAYDLLSDLLEGYDWIDEHNGVQIALRLRHIITTFPEFRLDNQYINFLIRLNSSVSRKSDARYLEICLVLDPENVNALDCLLELTWKSADINDLCSLISQRANLNNPEAFFEEFVKSCTSIEDQAELTRFMYFFDAFYSKGADKISAELSRVLCNFLPENTVGGEIKNDLFYSIEKLREKTKPLIDRQVSKNFSCGQIIRGERISVIAGSLVARLSSAMKSAHRY